MRGILTWIFVNGLFPTINEIKKKKDNAVFGRIPFTRHYLSFFKINNIYFLLLIIFLWLISVLSSVFVSWELFLHESSLGALLSSSSPSFFQFGLQSVMEERCSLSFSFHIYFKVKVKVMGLSQYLSFLFFLVYDEKLSSISLLSPETSIRKG